MKPDRQAALNKIRSSTQAAAHWAAAFRALEEPDFQRAYPLVRGYVLEKFMLTNEECTTDNILDLASLSLDKLLRLRKEGKLELDVSTACSAASSVITKKVLLMKAVSEDFEVTMTPAQSAQGDTLSALTRLILSLKGIDGG